MTKKPSLVKLKALANRLQVASEPTRLQILCLIFNKENPCVSEIAKELQLSIAVVSHHLQALYGAKLLEPSRAGKKICYNLIKNNFTEDLKNLICKYK